MKDDKEHLEIDLDFLDKKELQRVKVVNDPNVGKSKSGGKEHNWKNILIGAGLIIFLIAIFSGGSNSSSTSGGDQVATGQYRCSTYNHDRAGQLEPSKSEESRLDSESNDLAQKLIDLATEKTQLENEYVDEYDQYAIDSYNAKIDDLNARVESFKIKMRANSDAIDAYNARVETYNNFLIANCTKAY